MVLGFNQMCLNPGYEDGFPAEPLRPSGLRPDSLAGCYETVKVTLSVLHRRSSSVARSELWPPYLSKAVFDVYLISVLTLGFHSPFPSIGLDLLLGKMLNLTQEFSAKTLLDPERLSCKAFPGLYF